MDPSVSSSTGLTSAGTAVAADGTAKRSTGLSRASKAKQAPPPEASFSVMGAGSSNKAGFDPMGMDSGLPAMGGLP